MRIRDLLGIQSTRDKPQNSYSSSAYSFLFGRTTSGKPVNERKRQVFGGYSAYRNRMSEGLCVSSRPR